MRFSSGSSLIEEAYPLGINQEDINCLRMPDGKYLSCLEVKTEAVLYLFRMDALGEAHLTDCSATDLSMRLRLR